MKNTCVENLWKFFFFLNIKKSSESQRINQFRYNFCNIFINSQEHTQRSNQIGFLMLIFCVFVRLFFIEKKHSKERKEASKRNPTTKEQKWTSPNLNKKWKTKFDQIQPYSH